jgi:serine/threonine-protein kinase
MTDSSEAFLAQARARTGQVLCEKWRIDRLLGVGGMAAVFAATHMNNGRRVALKVLHTELGATPEVRSRFLREGYVANKVEHAGTVAVLDDQVAEDGSVFLVMELLEGESLEDRRERVGPLPAPEVLSLADRLLDVLAAAHDKGIVHRDIKPENVFLTRDGQVKVLDFGIARMLELSAARLTLTTAGAIGTPAFMPPEQARGRWDDVGPRSDLWAVGATMFTLVSGRLVHQAETLNELMLAAMTKHAPPVASVVPNVPAPTAALIDRALAYEIAARWPDARAMQAAARAAYAATSRPSAAIAPASAFARASVHEAPVMTVGRAASPPGRLQVLPMLGGLTGAIVMGTALLVVVARRAPPPSPAAAAETIAAPTVEAVPSPAREAATAAKSAPSASAMTQASATPKPKPGAVQPRPKR